MNQHIDQNNVLTFKLQWSKSDTLERVISSDIALFFNYVNNGVNQFGMASGTIKGYNIAEGSIVGILTIQSGTGTNTTSEQNLKLNSYDYQATQLQMMQSRSFLNYQYTTLPINMQTDLLQLTFLVNYGSYGTSNDTPSILGQLIWTWIQYFPLFLSIYWLCDKCMCYLLREGIIKRKLIHDPQLSQLSHKIR